MADELIDIYDENNKPLGIKKMKSEAHEKGLWHRVVHVWVYNSKKEILLQLRSNDKDIYPNRWEISATGNIKAGETEKEAAVRELAEEVGLKTRQGNLQLMPVMKVDYIFGKIHNREFFYIYLLKSEIDLSSLKVQEEEVQQANLFPAEELAKSLTRERDKFVAYGNYWEEMIDIIRRAK